MTEELSEFERARLAHSAAKAAGKPNGKAYVPADKETEGDAPLPVFSEPHRSFPMEVLPLPLREWAASEASFHQVPPSMAATFALMAAMTAGIHLTVQIRPGWEEPCVMQAMLAAAPSERKSPVFAAAFRPIYDWQRDQKKAAERKRESLQEEIDRMLVDSNGEAQPVRAGSGEAKRVADLKKQLSEVKIPRRLAEDVTPEEFMRLMADHDDTMCLASDEDVFQAFAGRYSQGEAKLSPLLKGWDAKTPLMYDRVGGGGGKQRTNIMIERPRAGVSLATQHRELTKLRENPAFREKGLLARLLYVVLGERQRERELCPEGVERVVRDGYSYTIQKLFQVDGEGFLLLANRKDFGRGWNMPQWLQDLRARVETGMLPGGEFEEMPDWAGKCVSNMARIAAVLEAIGGGGELQLAELSDFFISHAKRALLQMGSQSPDRGTPGEAISYVLNQVQEKWKATLRGKGRLRHSDPFTARDVMRVCRRFRNTPVKDFMPLLEELVRLGHFDELPNVDGTSIGNRIVARKFVLVVDIYAADISPTVKEEIPKTVAPSKQKPPPAPADPYSDWFDNQLDPEDDGR